MADVIVGSALIGEGYEGGRSDFVNPNYIHPTSSFMLSIRYTAEMDKQRSSVDPDAVLECRGERFSVHQEVLIRHESFFSVCFDHEFRERASRVVDIQDADPIHVAAMVRFMYEGAYIIGFPKNTLSDILAATAFHVEVFMLADRFQILDLRTYALEQYRNGLIASIELFYDTPTTQDQFVAILRRIFPDNLQIPSALTDTTTTTFGTMLGVYIGAAKLPHKERNIRRIVEEVPGLVTLLMLRFANLVPRNLHGYGCPACHQTVFLAVEESRVAYCTACGLGIRGAEWASHVEVTL
ncbi:hypothetical protein LTR17_020965 [Elasticomyces elasticus]|nr:hypothetical protein LTR17_020965 [Elasticomyces elasticus]